MSRETVQFVEMIRLAAAGLTQQPAQERKYPMYCDYCGHQTMHTLTISGDWEIYRCPCGERKEYRVR